MSDKASVAKSMHLDSFIWIILLGSAVGFAHRLLKRWARPSLFMGGVRTAQMKSISIPTFDAEHSSKVYQNLCKRLNISDEATGTDFLRFTTSELDDAVNAVDAPLLDDSKLSYAGFGAEVVGVADLLKSLVGEGCIVKMPLDNYKYGATIIPEEDYMKTTPVRYATVTDTNGYTVELVEAPPVNAGAVATGWVNRLILYVEDLEESIDFYTKVLGMTLYRKRSNVNSTPKDASFIAHVGYGDEKEGVCLELKYRYATDKITHRPRPCTLCVEVPNPELVRQAAATAPKCDWSRQVDGSAKLIDPSGYEVVVRASALP